MSDPVATSEPDPELVPELTGPELLHAQAEADHQTDWIVFVLACLVVSAALLLQVTGARDGVTIGGNRLPEICTVKRMGWGECPGCGLTRSFVLGVRLSPEAFRLHPAGPILLLVVVLQIPYRGGRLLAWRRRRKAGLPEPDPNRYEPIWRVLRWSAIVVVFLGWFLKLWLRG